MEEILQVIEESVVKGKRVEVEAKVREALEGQIPPRKILDEGLIAGMSRVGKLFETGKYYVPEMLVAARAMQAGLAILKPHLMEQSVEARGRVVVGTVQGDLHDIGKNLVKMMLEGAGFEVIDLGTDVRPEHFANAVREYSPDIVGLSALLTTTMRNMKATLEALEDFGVRDQVKVILGGAPVTQDYADEIGADGFAADASKAVTLAKSLASSRTATSNA
jgi:5-methyltetrahydrofolate--homocysteine methyltransferase